MPFNQTANFHDGHYVVNTTKKFFIKKIPCSLLLGLDYQLCQRHGDTEGNAYKGAPTQNIQR